MTQNFFDTDAYRGVVGSNRHNLLLVHFIVEKSHKCLYFFEVVMSNYAIIIVDSDTEISPLSLFSTHMLNLSLSISIRRIY